MNKLHVVINGNLTDKPIQKIVGKEGKKVTKFTIAHNASKGGQADYYKVEMWGERGDYVAKYLKKGSKVLVFANKVRVIPWLSSWNKPKTDVILTAYDIDF